MLSDGSTYAGRGVIVAANRQVDPSTGTLQVQALVPNPELVLRPGQYAHVRMKRQNEGKDALLVPEKALISVQGTYSIVLIGLTAKNAILIVEFAKHRFESGQPLSSCSSSV